MRIGIYGGTFDPVHLGHLILAETVREQAELDEVWFVPAFINPHKQGRVTAAVKMRLEMLRFAIAGNASFKLNEIEAKRKSPSYTVETLTEVRSSHPDNELFLIMGADSLTDFPTWREPETILKMAQLIVVNRGRSDVDVPKSVDCQRITICEMPAIDISSTEIRSRIATGKSIRYQTPRAVELYIETNSLYRDSVST